MKILFMITGLTRGGTENQLNNLVIPLSKEHDVRIICFKEGEVFYELKKKGIKAICLDVKNTKYFIRAITQTNRIWKQFRPDIVHSMLPHANIVAKIVNLIHLKKYPLICSIRVKEKRFLIFNVLERILDPMCNVVTTNSKTVKHFLVKFLRFKKSKVRVILNGYRYRKAKRIHLGRKVVVTVAQFRDQKDYTTNVDVCNLLRDSDVKFVYAGDGPKQKEIKDYVKLKGLQNKIQFLGSRDDVPDILTSADIFFLPTLYEGQSNAIVEAMHYKCPIVTTDIPENRELLNRDEAVLCPIRNKKSMANAIKNLLKDQKMAKKMCEKAYQKSQKFTNEKMIENHRKLYREVIKCVA